MFGGLTTKSQVLSFLHSKSGFSCKYLFLGHGAPAFCQHAMIYPSSTVEIGVMKSQKLYDDLNN